MAQFTIPGLAQIVASSGQQDTKVQEKVVYDCVVTGSKPIHNQNTNSYSVVVNYTIHDVETGNKVEATSSLFYLGKLVGDKLEPAKFQDGQVSPSFVNFWKIVSQGYSELDSSQITKMNGINFGAIFKIKERDGVKRAEPVVILGHSQGAVPLQQEENYSFI